MNAADPAPTHRPSSSPAPVAQSGRSGFPRWLKWTLIVLLGLALLGVLAATAGFFGLKAYYGPSQPDIAALSQPQLKVPLRVYASNGALIREFGAERRAPKRFGELPQPLVDAFLAAEDDRFFEHPGVDWQGLARAALVWIKDGERSQGGSTITMQLARNYFLSADQTIERKLREILLSLDIEKELSKQDILERYVNIIFMGNRAYGVGAAAEVYYGRDLADLTLAEYAMIAGLPKAPSRYNPIANPERALIRRNYVLRRMNDLDYISDTQYEVALGQPVTAELNRRRGELEADYAAEMVRAEMVARYGDAAYTEGLSVYTTIDPAGQVAANQSVRRALIQYDWRHGYRGPEQRLGSNLTDQDASDEGRLSRTALENEAMRARPQINGLPIALVTQASAKTMAARLLDGTMIELGEAGLEWADLSDESALEPGDLIRVVQTPADKADDGDAPIWKLAQIPQAQGAFVAVRPEDGAIQSMVGGFDFFTGDGKFNRVVQARRQPGSALKPFLYSAALGNGFTPASVINDAPVVFDDPNLEDTWRPENYTGRFYGPTRLREALTRSRNLVSIRLLRQLGIDAYRDHLEKFGFSRDVLPRDLSLALGTAVVSPLELARAYSVFANGGFLVDTYLIQEIRGPDGNVLSAATPTLACEDCDALQPAAGDEDAWLPKAAPRVLDAANAYLMTSMMQDVVQRGTARRARKLGRDDLAGKTGTTNDEMDAWFAGFNSSLVGIGWIGFDQLQPLGRGEAGGRAALPMWMDYMRVALSGAPTSTLERPAGIVTVRIDKDTGERASYSTRDAVFELFAQGSEPAEADPYSVRRPTRDEVETVEDLF